MHADRGGVQCTRGAVGNLDRDRFRPPRDFKYYKGNYLRSNGKSMWVSDLGRRCFAQVDGERRVELIPVGYNVFVVRDSDRIVMFDQDYNGEHNDVLIRSRARVAG